MSEQEEENLIRTLELRLLRCSVSSHHQKPDTVTPTTHICNLIEQVIELIRSGDYIGVLSSDAAKHVFNFDHCLCLGDCVRAEVFYSEVVVKRVEMFLSDDDNYERGCRVFLVMAIAVAAFLAFTQANKTGPLNSLPLMPLMPLLSKEEGVAGGWTDWEVWARNQLMLAGSDLLGKLSNLQYIVFAKILLMKLRDLLFEGSVYCIDGMRSISWWLARLLLFQQKMMDEQSSSLFDLLQVFTRECLHDFGTSEKVTAYWGAKLQEEEALTIVSTLHLEVGIMEQTYGRVDSSRLHFEAAEVASGLHLSVSGAMGFRTVHQVEPKTQLVLDTGTSTTNICTINKDDMLQDYCEASDVLMTPTLLGDNGNSVSSANGIQNGGITCLKEVQQAVILAQCLLIEKSTRQDEMQRWDMAPYIEAIDSQQFSFFTIRSFCDILRIRWESTRSRTKERALLMMDKLVQRVFDPSPGVAQRIYCCYVVDFPCIPALQKEHADILVRCGLIGEAVKIYEDLEQWDNVIYCYCLMEKKAAAVELINTRLSERPNDPRLWCSLGDITNDDACYEKALEVSENRSARAKRSLARSAYNRGDYESSKILWEAAMALNSLYPDGWFALGAAALKARDVDKALDGFTRSVQLDPENGEAWNNIACLHMVKKKNKESFIAFKEALKFKRNSWQLWENFSHVAADIGNFSQALEAVQKVLNMTNNKRIDTELLERMMLEIECRTLSCTLESPVETNSNDHNNNIIADSDARCVGEPTCSEVDTGRTRETEHLVELIGKILQQIVQSGGGAETWGLFARWHKLKGDLTMCSEALIKQVRSYQGSNLWKDVVQFKKFARASLELCKVYLELASRNSSRRELLAAEMHLKSTIRQASSFSETEEYRDLQACLDKVQT